MTDPANDVIRSEGMGIIQRLIADVDQLKALEYRVDRRSVFVPAYVGQNQTDATWVFRSDIGVFLADNKVTSCYGEFSLPVDFVDGSTLTITAVVVCAVNGNIYSSGVAYGGGLNQQYQTNTDFSFAAAYPIVANDNNPTSVISTVQWLGNLVKLSFTRDATNPLDTLNFSAYLCGWLVEYQSNL